MEIKDDILCLIPARGGSKRLARKNILDLNSRPLISYTVKAAQESSLFKTVFVSTEDAEIASISRKFGAEVIERPEHMASDSTRLWELCLYTLKELESKGKRYEEFCLLLPTLVLRKAEDIKETYRVFKEKDSNFAVTVTEVPGEFSPYWTFTAEDGYLKEFFEAGLARKRQDLPRFFIANQAVNFAKVSAFKKEKTLVGTRCSYYVLPRERAVDIDTAFDFELVKYLLSRQENSRDLGKEAAL